MHCELLVSGIPASPALELLVARGRRTGAPVQQSERWLQHAFGLEGRLAAGALSLLGAGGAPGDALWARADPVHLQVMRDRVLLAPALEITPEEADAACAALNRHFAGTLELRALDPAHWCARLEREMELGDDSPLDVAGREATMRPGDALLTEIQMLLHAEPLNAAREARGEPALNSVWFWGAGRLPAGAQSRWRSVTSSDPVALGLARLAGAAAQALPQSADAWLARAPEDGRHLVVLDSPHQDWFPPLCAALRAGRVGMITVHLPAAGLASETARGDLRRFWRRAKALADYA